MKVNKVNNYNFLLIVNLNKVFLMRIQVKDRVLLISYLNLILYSFLNLIYKSLYLLVKVMYGQPEI